MCVIFLIWIGHSAAAALAADPTSTTDAPHWAWRPIAAQQSPAVSQSDWPRGNIDRFILARLEKEKLSPAGPCDRAALLRRATFIVTGLPPSPQEVTAFQTDASPDAFARVVDRLLASPHFGERWARHWMDLVRYSETLGNEADAPIPNAWRYRDYLIRAFNADLPYNQFVTEHVAGDLLPTPRRNPADGNNESIIATGFFWMNEGKRSPVDVKLAEADCFDNKLDVMCKSFLGLTVACARCHDHKFDPISTADYYGVYGYLKSSRYTQAELNRQVLDAQAASLLAIRAEIRRSAAGAMIIRAGRIARYLDGTVRAMGAPVDVVAADDGLSAGRLRSWVSALGQATAPAHPMYPWTVLASAGQQADAKLLATRWSELHARLAALGDVAAKSQHRAADVDLVDFRANGFAGWFPEDQSFSNAPQKPGDFLMGDAPDHPILTVFRGGASAHSGFLSKRLEGTLRSPTFTLQRRYLHVLAAGRGSRINLNLEHFVMIQSPLYDGLRKIPASDGPAWLTFDLSLWPGRDAYLECSDTTTQDLHDQGAPTGAAKNGFVALNRVILSDDSHPPDFPTAPAGLRIATGPAPDSLHALAIRMQDEILTSLKLLQDDTLQTVADSEAPAQLLAWLIENHLLDAGDDTTAADVTDDAAAPARLAALFGDFKKAEEQIADPIRCPAMIDGTPQDEHIFIRGSHDHAGPVVERRLPAAIFGASQPHPTGSGRLELAREMTDPARNPFISRVIVNRIWHHVFGAGLVTSVDNFGALGSAPSHPELLDYLAARFTHENGWSIKALLREMLLSNTFAMSSAPAAGDASDPDDRLLHHMRVRRLDAEAIRDSILSVAGTLDEKLYGPSVEIYLTPELDGYIGSYGRPAQSGPIDGGGRRSVYQAIRRNFLSPLMLAFDAPPPLNTAGRRNVSNVPAQALILMNDPFVAQEALAWAQRSLAGSPDASQRITNMYIQAFARPPSAQELTETQAFLHDHAGELGVGADDPRLWADLAHVLFNVKEFVFVN